MSQSRTVSLFYISTHIYIASISMENSNIIALLKSFIYVMIFFLLLKIYYWSRNTETFKYNCGVSISSLSSIMFTRAFWRSIFWNINVWDCYDLSMNWLILLPLWNNLCSPSNICLALWSNSCDANTATRTFFWLMLLWYTSFYLFIFNLFMSLYLKCNGSYSNWQSLHFNWDFSTIHIQHDFVMIKFSSNTLKN